VSEVKTTDMIHAHITSLAWVSERTDHSHIHRLFATLSLKLMLLNPLTIGDGLWSYFRCLKG